MAGDWNVVTDINILLQAVFQEGNWIITEIVQSKRNATFFITKYVFLQLIHKRYDDIFLSLVSLIDIFIWTFILSSMVLFKNLEPQKSSGNQCQQW